MEKRQLVDILHHYNSSTLAEAEEIVALRNTYPYSQLLQALAARAAKDHNLHTQDLLLQSAAVHATDRSVLKGIMAAQYIPSTNGDTVVLETPAGTETAPPVDQPSEGIDYAEEVLHDLQKLHDSKVTFETLLESLGTLHTEPEPKPVRRPPGRPRKKIEPETDVLIESIKATKKEIDPESPKTAEQIAIIDQFIKAQPNIASKVKPTNNTPAADLSSGIKSGEYPESIISETLAEILIRQGKKEKAIEVYKKLIWKFPQKKAYFAGQIEDLKK